MSRFTHENKKRGQQNQIEREMGGEAPVFAGVTEASAGDIEATDFCGDGGDNEDADERG